MCEKAFKYYSRVLEFVPDCFKNKKMCKKAAQEYPYPLEFFLDCFNTGQIRKSVNEYPCKL